MKRVDIPSQTYFELNANDILIQHGITKTMFAELINVKPQNVNKIISTKNIFSLMKIAQILDKPLEYIVYGDNTNFGSFNISNICGYIEIDNTIYKVNNFTDLKRITEIASATKTND